jgi:hypothetical protein
MMPVFGWPRTWRELDELRGPPTFTFDQERADRALRLAMFPPVLPPHRPYLFVVAPRDRPPFSYFRGRRLPQGEQRPEEGRPEGQPPDEP